MISYSSLVKNGVASVRGEASGRFHDLPPRIFVPTICPSPTITPYRGENQYASHPVHWEGDMHRTLCIELSVWSSFDHLWAVFSGERLGDDVISWPCSFRQWSKTFRDLRALNLWTFVIGVEVPKNVYNNAWWSETSTRIIRLDRTLVPSIGELQDVIIRLSHDSRVHQCINIVVVDILSAKTGPES